MPEYPGAVGSTPIINRRYPHNPDDTDRDRDAGHHTLGDKPWQAAPGNHTHDYVTPDSLTTTLLDYPTDSELAATLLGYPTDAELSTALADYVLKTNDWQVLVKPSDESNNTVTAADIAGLHIPTNTPVGLYVYEAYIYFQTAATTTGFQLNLSFPAEVTGAFRIDVPNSATATVMVQGKATGDKALGTAVAVANATYLARITGLLRINSALSGTIRPRFNSEIAASNVKVMADSTVMYRKVA